MSASRRSLANMPDWPRLMSEQQAASYVGLSINTFRSRIGNPWPEPIRIGRRKVFDRASLDRAVDELSEAEEDFPTKLVR